MDTRHIDFSIDSKATRRAARERIGAYHEEQLAALLDHVRDGLRRFDAGELDAFDLDDVIHQYKRAAQELWKFCNCTGGRPLSAVRTLEYWEAEGEARDWWQSGAPRRRRS